LLACRGGFILAPFAPEQTQARDRVRATVAANKIDSGIYELLRDVGDRIGADRVGDVLSGLLDGAARTRDTLERNVESLLGYANIPSRSEYDALLRVVEGLTTSVERLSKRIDTLAARSAAPAAGVSDKARRARPKKPRPSRPRSGSRQQAAAKPPIKPAAAKQPTKPTAAKQPIKPTAAKRSSKKTPTASPKRKSRTSAKTADKRRAATR
jgi:hypothetical protein